MTDLTSAQKLGNLLSAASADLTRECDDADELLRLMFPSQQPDDFRTDGGAINLPKVRELWARAHGVGAAPVPAEPVSPALERQRRLVATLPQTAEDAEALRAGHRELWRVDLPDGAYTQLPGDPPGPASLRRVQNGIVYDAQPLSGRLIPASKPRMLPGCVTTAVGVEDKTNG